MAVIHTHSGPGTILRPILIHRAPRDRWLEYRHGKGAGEEKARDTPDGDLLLWRHAARMMRNNSCPIGVEPTRTEGHE